VKKIESLLISLGMKFEFQNLKIRFHKRQVSFRVVKTVKCKRDMRCALDYYLHVDNLAISKQPCKCAVQYRRYSEEEGRRPSSYQILEPLFRAPLLNLLY